MIKEVNKLYNEGLTMHEAMYKVAGQQGQMEEKDKYWSAIEKAIKEYDRVYKQDTGLREIKEEFYDRSLLDFMFGFADELSYQTRYKIDESALSALILSALIMEIVEG